MKARVPEAWQRLAELYGPLVYGWCRRRGLQPHDADEVLQEVFLTVSRRIDEFRRDRPGDTFRGWLWTITRNKLGDWIRRQETQVRTLGGTDVPDQSSAAPIEDPPSEPDPAEVSALYRRALDLIRSEFAEPSWQAFWQVVVEHRRPADVAADLKLSRNAVYIAKSRILHRLREVLGDPV